MLVALAFVALLCAEPDRGSVAPDPTPSGEALTLGRAYEAALLAHEDRLYMQASVEGAAADLRGARADLLPSASLSAGASWSGSDTAPAPAGTSLSSTLSVSQPLLYPSAVATYRAWGARQVSAREGAEDTRLALLHQVAAAFYEAVAAEEVLAARQADVALSLALLEGMEARVRLGAAIPLTALRARVAVANARASEATAVRDRDVAALSLARLVGFLPQSISALDLTEIPEPVDSGRPTPRVREARASEEAARLSLQAWRASRIPTASLWGNVGPDLTVGDGSAPTLSWQAGVSAGWTLYGGGGVSAGVDGAQADLLATHASTLATERDAALAVQLARASRQAALARVRAQEEALDAAQQNLEGIRAMLNVGKATPLEVADAAATLAEAESTLIQARLERDLATLSWYEALGLPPPGAP